MMYAMLNFSMPSIVTTFNDMTGMQPRKGTTYAAGTVGTSLSETYDLDNDRQLFDRNAEYTLTPGEAGTQYFLTDRRLATDPESGIQSDLAEHFGYTVFKAVETALLGHMPSFTGGTIGTAGGTLTWGNIYSAVAILRATGAPAPYYVMLHEYHYHRLAQAANIAGLSNAAPLQIRDGIQTNYLVQQISNGVFLYTTGVPTAGTAVYGGVFSRRAIAYDPRRGLKLEYERDASLRGWEVNGTHWYATGLPRAAYGVTLLGDASTPTS
jgi:hypothetical protein